MDRKRKRQPPGIPIGGQFAPDRAAEAAPSVVLEDPWADLDLDTPAPVTEPEPAPEPEPVASAKPAVGMGLEAERALIADINTAMGNVPASDADHAAARSRILARYGSFEQAVIALGHSVAARAEHAAGITAEQVRASWAQRAEKSQAAVDEAKRLARNARTARELLDAATKAEEVAGPQLELREGRDPQTRADLRRLADGYYAALSELREMGGQIDWHERTKREARDLFDEAASVYPADWIAASNAHTTNRRGESVGKPLARISKTRAHHHDGKTLKTRKKVVAEEYTTPSDSTLLALKRYGRSTNRFYEYRPLTEEEQRANPHAAATHMVTKYEVCYVDNPVSKGWEWWTNPADPDEAMWRRPLTRMVTVSEEEVPEVTTNLVQQSVEGRPDGFAVAVHELAHRFEVAVDGLSSLEDEFLRRRTTDERGNREKLVRLYSGSREYAYPDSFPVTYMGKVYRHGSYEIMSMGTQSLFGGDFGGLVGAGAYAADPECRAFVLGAMAALPGARRASRAVPAAHRPRHG